MYVYLVTAAGYRETWPTGEGRPDLRTVGVFPSEEAACEALDETALRDLGPAAYHTDEGQFTYRSLDEARANGANLPTLECRLPDGSTWQAWTLVLDLG